jgi:hypothetical protein
VTISLEGTVLGVKCSGLLLLPRERGLSLNRAANMVVALVSSFQDLRKGTASVLIESERKPRLPHAPKPSQSSQQHPPQSTFKVLQRSLYHFRLHVVLQIFFSVVFTIVHYLLYFSKQQLNVGNVRIIADTSLANYAATTTYTH